MYCERCGSQNSMESKQCYICGAALHITLSSDVTETTNATINAADDLSRKLKVIAERKKPTKIKNYEIASALEQLRKETAGFRLSFGDAFEIEKFEEQKRLILEYPLPTTSEELVCFARFVNSSMLTSKKKSDALTSVWKEKLKQVFEYAKSQFSSTDAFLEIQKLYKDEKRRERHLFARDFVFLLILPIIVAFIISLVFQLPLLTYAAVLAAGWEVFLILYVCDLLEKVIEKSKKQGNEKKGIPKILRVIIWHLPMPLLAFLIVSLIYDAEVWSIVAFALFLIGMFALSVIWMDED